MTTALFYVDLMVVSGIKFDQRYPIWAKLVDRLSYNQYRKLQRMWRGDI